MNDQLKPMDNSEEAFVNDLVVDRAPIKPITNSEAFTNSDEPPVFTNAEPENKPSLSSYINDSSTPVDDPIMQNSAFFSQYEAENPEDTQEEVIEETIVEEETTPTPTTNGVIPKERAVLDEPELVPPPDPVSLIKQKANYKGLIKFVAIVVILICVGKLGLDFFYTHDSHATVSTNLEFAEETTELSISNLKFDIPTNLKVENWIGYFTIEQDEFVVRVDIYDYEFNTILGSYQHLTVDEEATYNGKAKIEKYGDKEYVVADAAKWLSKKLVAFTEAPDNKVLYITIINKKNTYDYKLLEKVSSILNTVNDGKAKKKEAPIEDNKEETINVE